MKRRDFIKGVGVAGLSTTQLSFAIQKQKKKLVVLHTNDQHSRIDPFPKNHPKHAGLGGFARRAFLIDQIRNEGAEVLLLDAGDVFQGTPYFNFYGGELEFKLMSMMGYDAMTLGNHEFDNGIEGLMKQMPHAKFDFINANYGIENSALRGKVKPYKVFNKGGIKVGVYGLGVELAGLVQEEHYRGLVYQDPIKISQDVEKILKEKLHCDLVICLSHLGYSYDGMKVSDLELAKHVQYTDLILGGHTHTFLDTPVNIVNSYKKKIIISQTGWAGINLGRIDFEYNGNEGVLNTDSAMIKVS